MVSLDPIRRNSRFVILAFDGAVVFTCLALFLCQYPDKIRTALWEEGGALGFNSDPKQRIYFYANYKTPPEIPYIWTQPSTSFNVGVALLCFCLWLVRGILNALGALSPWTQLYLHFCMLVPLVMSFFSQIGSDLSDPKHPSRVPWYLTRSCLVASEKFQRPCHIGKASFVMTVILMIFYAIWTFNILMLVLKNRPARSEAAPEAAPMVVRAWRSEDRGEVMDASREAEQPLMGDKDEAATE